MQNITFPHFRVTLDQKPLATLKSSLRFVKQASQDSQTSQTDRNSGRSLTSKNMKFSWLAPLAHGNWIDLVKEAVLGNPLDKMLLLQNITFPSIPCYFGLEASGNTEKQSTLRQASRSSPPVKSSQIDRTSGILILRHRFIMF